MALNDLYFLINRYEWTGGEEMMNTYTYQRATVAGTATHLVNAFVEDVLPAVRGIQSGVINHIETYAYNLGDLSDFATVTHTGVTGTRALSTGETLPPHSAINFTLKGNSRAVRPGSKRYPGIGEQEQQNGVITTAAYITLLNTLRSALIATIQAGAGEGFSPVIIKRVKEVVNGVARYRMPTSTDPAPTVVPITQAIVNLTISHQVSRGNGR